MKGDSLKEDKTSSAVEKIQRTVEGERRYALIHGDTREILDSFPKGCVDCVITSPPYWKQRRYESSDEYSDLLIGNENNIERYIGKIMDVFEKVKKILRPKGSIWLNLGDKYYNKNLVGVPWRVALVLQEKGWILRNDVIWDQMKGTQSANDRLRMNYEHIFHFTKNKKYYYADEKIRKKPEKRPKIRGRDKEVISATGVSGKKYRRQIRESKELNEEEKKSALGALENTLDKMRDGEIVDFRMTIRGKQRALHSDNLEISGRARELKEKGYYIISSSSQGCMPDSIWKIVPEDKWRKDSHYAVFPVELLEIPIKATCPENGIILDPFVGIGSTVVAAIKFGRRGIGIDIVQSYLDTARNRLKGMQKSLNFY